MCIYTYTTEQNMYICKHMTSRQRQLEVHEIVRENKIVANTDCLGQDNVNETFFEENETLFGRDLKANEALFERTLATDTSKDTSKDTSNLGERTRQATWERGARVAKAHLRTHPQRHKQCRHPTHTHTHTHIHTPTHTPSCLCSSWTH